MRPCAGPSSARNGCGARFGSACTTATTWRSFRCQPLQRFEHAVELLFESSGSIVLGGLITVAGSACQQHDFVASHCSRATGLPRLCQRNCAETTTVMIPTAMAMPLNFATNMAVMTPSESEMTAAETAAAAVGPAATNVAARAVDSIKENGTVWARTAWIRIVDIAAGSTTPRDTSRLRSRDLARASRLDSVPSGMPSRSAASAQERPRARKARPVPVAARANG